MKSLSESDSQRRREAGPGGGVEASRERSHHVGEHGERSVNGTEIRFYFRHPDMLQRVDIIIDKYLLSIPDPLSATSLSGEFAVGEALYAGHRFELTQVFRVVLGEPAHDP